MIHSKFNAGTSVRLQRFLTIVLKSFGLNVDLSSSAGFRLTIESRDGDSISARVEGFDKGLPASLNPNPLVGSVTIPVNTKIPVAGTLVAGVKDITLANVEGDTLAVRLVTPDGVPGVNLAVVRKDNSTVTVTSYRKNGTTVETLDTSVVEAFNLGQA
jgi:hypothetical protein